MTLRVMSFNLRYASETAPNAWSARRSVASACLAQTAPDLIATQEGFAAQLADIARDRPELSWIGAGRDDGGEKGEHAAIFYRRDRLEALETHHFWLSDTPEVVASTSWGNRVVRMTTWARFRDLKSGVEFAVWNTHFDHESQFAREKSAALMIERIGALPRDLPLLLAGDFNAEARANPVYDAFLKAGFADAYESAEQRTGPNFASFHGYQTPVAGGAPIDWILTRGAVRSLSAGVVDFGIGGQLPSDHFPVMASLEIGSKNESALER